MRYGTKEAADFLNGKGLDAAGRSVADYLKFDNATWEECHNHIQWAFPSHIVSQFNPDAPVVDMGELVELLNRDGYHNVFRLLTAYLYSLGFVGRSAEWYDDNSVWVLDENNPLSEQWQTPFNHNYLRITRVLNLLHYLDVEVAARYLNVFLNIASKNDATKRTIGVQTVVYWSKAAIGKL